MTAPAPVEHDSRPPAFPCRALAFGLFPVALIPPVPLPWTECDIRPACVYVLLFVLWGAACGASRAARSRSPGWPVWLFLAALLALQAAGIHASALYLEADLKDAAGTYCHLLLQVATLLLYAVGVRLLCGLPGGPVWLARGAVCSLLLLLGVCGAQVIWLLTGPEFPAWLARSIVLSGLPDSAAQAIAGLHERLTSVLVRTGAWPAIRDALRPAGVYASSSELAVVLAAAYGPIVLAGLTTAGAWGRRACGALTAGMIAVLIGGRSPTAAGACLFLLVWLARRVLWQPGRRARACVFMALVAGLCAGALCHDAATHRLADRVSAWAGGSEAAPLPEETVARELWTLAREHPWTGVGYGWSSVHVIHGAHYEAILRDAETTGGAQELQAWREDPDALPTPSLLLEFLAVFGFVPALAAAASFFWLWRRLRGLSGKCPKNLPLLPAALAATGPYSTAVAVFSLGDVDWTNPLLFLPCFCLWAMVGLWEKEAGLRTYAAGGKPVANAGKTPVVHNAGTRISDSPSRPFTL